MAARYWVGGTGNWGDTSHWSTSSGGGGGSSVPGSTDDVFIDQNSGSPIVSTNGSFITVLSAHIGNSAYTTNQTVKNVTLNFSNNGDLFGISSGGLWLYGDANITFLNYTNEFYFASSNAGQNAYCYTTVTIPFVQMQGSGGDLTLNGTWYVGKTDVSNGGKLVLPAYPGHLYTGFLNQGTGTSKLDENTNFVYIWSQMIDFTKTGAPASPGVSFLNPTATTLLNPGTIIAGSLVDQFGITTANQRALTLTVGNYTYSNGTTLTGSVEAAAGKVTLTGNCTWYSISCDAGAQLTIQGTNTAQNGLFVGGDILLPPAETQTVNTLTNNFSGTLYEATLASSTPGSNATITISNPGGLLTRIAFQDITFSTPVAALHSTDNGNNGNIKFIYGFNKIFSYAVTDSLGVNILTQTLGRVRSDPSFSRDINAPAGECVIILNEDPDTYTGSGTTLRNIVTINVKSDDFPSGTNIYKGFISGWKPVYSSNDKHIEVTLLPFGAELQQYLVINDPTIDTNISQSATPISPVTISKIAASFTTGGSTTNLTGFNLGFIGYKNASFITVKVYKDNGSNTPDNTASLKTIVNFTGATPNASYNYLNYLNTLYGSGIAASTGSKYWVVATTDGTFDTNQLFTTNSYGSGNGAYWNGTTWVQSSSTGVSVLQTYTSNTATTVAYSGADWKTAAQDIFTNFNLQGGKATLNVVDDPAVTFTALFQNSTVLSAIGTLLAQAPSDYYWYEDVANAQIVIKRRTNISFIPASRHPESFHKFSFEVDVIDYNLEVSMEPVINDLFIIGGNTGGGVNLFREYINADSVARYGRRQAVYQDSTLTNSTAADAIGISKIQASWGSVVRAPIVIASYPDRGYPIELIDPGDMFVVQNTVQNVTPQISRVDYKPSSASLTASTVPTQVQNQTQDNTQTLQQIASVGNPTAPTVVQV